MRKIKIMSILFIIVAFSLSSASIEDIDEEKDAIQEVVIEGYIGPIFKSGDIEAIKKGFHPKFNMLILRENNLVKYPLEEWIKSIKKREYPTKDVVVWDIIIIDITGNAAVVKVKINISNQRKYSDYLSLYKFKDGWKIVIKIYFQHN